MCDYCSWIEKVLGAPERDIILPLTICTNVTEPGGRKDEELVGKALKHEPTILVHGTADSTSSRAEIELELEVIEEAAIEAYRQLLKGDESAHCAELAIRRVESRNSISSSFANTPSIRDAAMMGSDSNAGSVGALDSGSVKHAVALARRVMQNTDHVLVVGSGVARLVNDSDDAMDAEMARKSDRSEDNDRSPKVCAALARDRQGHLTSAITTWESRKERVARSSMSATGAVIGCGTFADEHSCCTVSAQPDEAVYVRGPARQLVARLASVSRNVGKIEDTLEKELREFVEGTSDWSSAAGVAALTVEGEPRVAHATKFFPWAFCYQGHVTSGCTGNEITARKLEDLDVPLDCECQQTV